MVSAVSLLRRIFNGPYRRARAAEGAGDYRRAAALYAEADLPEEAANALLFHAARAGNLEDRLSALLDVLRWLAPDHPRRREVEAQIGLAVLDDAQRHGVVGAEGRRRLAEAARRLEAAGRPADAASGYELLGATDDVARCLQEAGEIDRLEALLEKTGEAEREERRMRGLVSDYQVAMRYGARADARQALRSALNLTPESHEIAGWLRELEARMPRANRVELRVDGRRIVFVGAMPVTVGRADAEIAIRGLSMSRRHAVLSEPSAGSLRLEDLGSKNGTYVRGFALEGSLDIGAPIDVSFGEDVTLRITPGGAGPAAVEVIRGIDRGTIYHVVSSGPLRIEGDPRFGIDFVEGWARVVGDRGCEVRLAGELCALPVHLLVGDRIDVASASGITRIEVLG